jgi:hypothetical protein
MNKKERQAILNILLIKENLNENEFDNVLQFITEISSNKISMEKILKDNFSSRKRNTESITQMISAFKTTDSDKYKTLNDFYKLTKDGTVFRSFPEVKIFIESSGLKQLLLKNKQETINEILRFLCSIANEEIMSLLTNHVKDTHDDGYKSYKNLSDFIINPNDEKL